MLQDLRYTYDPTGNITHIVDDAQQTLYFSNQVVTPTARYRYDALYRLISAEGREHIGQATQPETTWDDRFRTHLPHPHDGQAMRRYVESYHYDDAGNILQLQHQARGTGWTRGYTYDEASQLEPAKPSNRLSTTAVGDATEVYSYDAHGNTTAMAHLSGLSWNFLDQLAATSRQVVVSGPPETTYYTYDAGGTRTRKVTERQNGSRKHERIYSDGFEVYREFDGGGDTVALERETLHVAIGERIALVESRTQGTDGSPTQLIRYQLSNHLGTATLELDGLGDVISYEEYYPYGSTSYQAVRSQTEPPKRYRYTGMERDDETGLAYHSARYYAAWLGRWTSADPIGVKGGPNLYEYCSGSPVVHSDITGHDKSIARVNANFDKDNDKTISLRELVEGLVCIEGLSITDWATMMNQGTGGYRVDRHTRVVLKVLSSPDARAANGLERTAAGREDSLQMGKEGRTFTRRERAEAGRQYLKRHQNPQRLINMVKVGVAVVAPEVAAVAGAYDAGVQVGEAITGVRSWAGSQTRRAQKRTGNYFLVRITLT